MTNKELIQNFETLVREERRVTRQVLAQIAEIESRRAYLDLGYDGMYAYLTRGLGYSEGAAYRRLQAARVLRAVPVVAEKFVAGSVNLTQLAEVAKASRQAKQIPTAELFTKLESQSKAASEQIIAQEFAIVPQTEVRRRTQSDHSVRLELTFTAEQFAELEKARSLLSHICPNGNWPDVFAELALQYTKRFKPREKRSPAAARRSAAPAKSKDQKVPCIQFAALMFGNKTTEQPTEANWAPAPLVERRRSIQVTRRRLIFSRADGRCEHKDPHTGKRCESRYQPQVDHINPVSRGGSNEPENLQLLCAIHNRAKGASAAEILKRQRINH